MDTILPTKRLNNHNHYLTHDFLDTRLTSTSQAKISLPKVPPTHQNQYESITLIQGGRYTSKHTCSYLHAHYALNPELSRLQLQTDKNILHDKYYLKFFKEL